MKNTDVTKWKVYALVDLKIWKEFKTKCDIRKINDIVMDALLYQIKKES